MKQPEKKARAPDGSRSATGSQSAWGVVLFALQCAQRIGQWLTLLFVAHVLVTVAASIIDPALKAVLLPILDSCQNTYRLGLAAYFGKAAVENALKIWNSVKSLTGASTSSDGNG